MNGIDPDAGRYRFRRGVDGSRHYKRPRQFTRTTRATGTAGNPRAIRPIGRHRTHRRQRVDGSTVLQHLHRVDVNRVRRAPERRGAVERLEAAVGVAAIVEGKEPEVFPEADIGIGPGSQHRVHQLEVRDLLRLHRLRLRVARARRPHRVQRSVQRRETSTAADLHTRAALHERHRQIELSIDRRHEQRGAAVAGGDFIDLRAAIEKGHRRTDVALTRRVMQRRHAAHAAHGPFVASHLPFKQLGRLGGLDHCATREHRVAGFDRLLDLRRGEIGGRRCRDPNLVAAQCGIGLRCGRGRGRSRRSRRSRRSCCNRRSRRSGHTRHRARTSARCRRVGHQLLGRLDRHIDDRVARLLREIREEHLVPLLGRRLLTRQLFRKIDQLGADRRIGAASQQRTRGIAAVLGRREHQGRLSPRQLERIGIGLVCQQRLHRRHVTGRGGQVHRRRPRGRERLCIGTGRQQGLHHRTMAGSRRHVQRRVAAVLRRARELRAGTQQQRRHRDIPAISGPVQRGHAVALRHVYIVLLREQRTHLRHVALHRRVGDGRRDACLTGRRLGRGHPHHGSRILRRNR